MLQELLTAVRDLLQEYLNLNVGVELLGRILNTIAVLLLFWILRSISLRVVNRQFRQNTRVLYNWHKVIKYSYTVFCAVFIGRIWLSGVDTLVTYLGLVSAGVAIALQDPIVSAAGWVYLVWRRLFTVGDRIEINGTMGDVIDIGVFSFSLLEVGHRIDAEQSTGRIIHFPNGMLFKEPVINTHQGYPFIWNEIPVMITFESNWEKAKAILTQIINQLAPDVKEGIQRYEKRADRLLISYDNISPALYLKVVSSSGVALTLRYLVDPRRRRGSEQEIWEAILRAFKQNPDIEFAYPTQREYIRYYEKHDAPSPPEATAVVQRQAAAKQKNEPTKVAPPATSQAAEAPVKSIKPTIKPTLPSEDKKE